MQDFNTYGGTGNLKGFIMKNWFRQQWKPALIAGFFMFLTIGFLFAGGGCSTVMGAIEGTAIGVQRDVQSMRSSESYPESE